MDAQGRGDRGFHRVSSTWYMFIYMTTQSDVLVHDNDAATAIKSLTWSEIQHGIDTVVRDVLLFKA